MNCTGTCVILAKELQKHRANLQQGENPLGLLAVLTRDLNLTMELNIAAAKRENTAGFLKKRGVFQPQRAKAVEQAARRLNRHQLNTALELCSTTDRAAKGFDTLSPWHYLQDLITLLARPA
jgi:DNA polymerase-3 subunit delta